MKRLTPDEIKKLELGTEIAYISESFFPELEILLATLYQSKESLIEDGENDLNFYLNKAEMVMIQEFADRYNVSLDRKPEDFEG
jgi:hypothetical protein